MVAEMFRRFFLVLTFRLRSIFVNFWARGWGATENKTKDRRKVFPMFARHAMELYYAVSYEEKFTTITKTFAPLGNKTALVCIQSLFAALRGIANISNHPGPFTTYILANFHSLQQFFNRFNPTCTHFRPILPD